MGFTVPNNLTVNSGRPDLRTISKDIVARTAELKTGGSHGVLVASCGPLTLNRDVRKAAVGSCSDKSIRDAIGGIEIHEEYVYSFKP